MWYLSVDETELIQSLCSPGPADKYKEVTEEEAMAHLNSGYVIPGPEPPPVYSNEVLTAAMIELTKDL